MTKPQLNLLAVLRRNRHRTLSFQEMAGYGTCWVVGPTPLSICMIIASGN